jgi:hypothetical protein
MLKPTRYICHSYDLTLKQIEDVDGRNWVKIERLRILLV